MTDERPRCSWAAASELDRIYHDEEWGVPAYDDRDLFERLLLEGFQAGLSWTLILRKRAALTEAFAGWDAERIAGFDEEDIARLLANPAIVRNRLKVRGAITNARAYLALRDHGETLSDVLWNYVDGTPVINRWASEAEIPAFTETSTAMSKDLKRRGFSFVGPTICYALMQSIGMVNDHAPPCFLAPKAP